MNNHPAYPSSTTLAREGRIEAVEHDALFVNAWIAKVLKGAAVQIETMLQPSVYCMSTGYDWSDIVKALREMAPKVDDKTELQRLRDWASEQEGE